MRLTSSVTGISKIILILLLLISFIAGALFSYVYTMGYYAPFEFLLPDKPVFSIQSVEFSKRDTSFFDVTVVNPSFSQSDVNITRIEARTTDDNRIHSVASTVPQMPFLLLRGRSQTFRAFWNWANYTGIKLPYTDTPVEVRVFLQSGRGEVLELKRPLVIPVITELTFNQSISVNHFNVTVQNLGSSETYINVTAFFIENYDVPTGSVTPELPYTLNPGDDPVRFQCFYNWNTFMNQSATITVRTRQGYIAQQTLLLPKPVTLNITQIVFNATANPQGLNVTMANYAGSSTYVDIDRVTVAVGQQAPVNITEWTAIESSRLDTNASVLIVCSGWDWSTYTGQSARVTVYTLQGFTVSRETQIP